MIERCVTAHKRDRCYSSVFARAFVSVVCMLIVIPSRVYIEAVLLCLESAFWAQIQNVRLNWSIIVISLVLSWGILTPFSDNSGDPRT